MLILLQRLLILITNRNIRGHLKVNGNQSPHAAPFRLNFSPSFGLLRRNSHSIRQIQLLYT